ncbi:hypothetical protein LUZ60_012813 [Juncus effusus]|nr:hypothetical protein LUZ60_012813 [Juncus effusus]
MSQIAKETGLVAVDCVVISCCCPCLILQITIFLFIRLPHKLAVKTKRIILRKLHKRSKKRKLREIQSNGGIEEENTRGRNESLQHELSEFHSICDYRRVLFVGSSEDWIENDSWINQDMEFVNGDRSKWFEEEKNVWRELIEKEGLFWFGNFWANGDFT